MTHFDENGKLVVCTDNHDHAVKTLTSSSPTDAAGQDQTPEVR
jgi:hypothetical protein